jgi:hypothetical protein
MAGAHQRRPRRVARLQGTLWECPQCGKLWVDDVRTACVWCQLPGVASGAKGRRLAVNVDQELWREVHQAAQAAGVSAGELVRRLVLERLKPPQNAGR